MRITEKQLQMMFIILTDSAKINMPGIFTLDFETRGSLFRIIAEQQSNELIEVKDK